MSNEIYFNVPTIIADSLRCSYCNSYLSCGPITREPHTKKYFCGRCESPSSALDEVLYEAAMRNFAFPCRFDDQGCLQLLLFNNVLEHESNCSHRTFQCPAMPQTGCLEMLSVKNTTEHFFTYHSHLILKDYIKLELHTKNVNSSLLIIENDAIIVASYFYNVHKKLLSISAGFLKKSDLDELNYKIQIKEPSEYGRSIDLQWNLCKPYRISKNQENEILLDKYLLVFENPSVIYVKLLVAVDKIGLNSEKPVHAIIETPRYSNYNNEKEEMFVKLMSELEHIACTNCSDIIIPPIYKRNTDDRDLLYCLSCAARVSCTLIEKNIENYPCRWKGCTFIGNHNDIKTHVKNCKFIRYVCSFCDPKNKFLMTLDTVMNHLQEHAEYCPNPKSICIDLFNFDNTTETKRYFTIFENKIVYFTCDLLPEKKWKFICQSEHDITFKVSYEHDHCRHRRHSKLYKDSFTIDSINVQLKGCFSSYNFLKIILIGEILTVPPSVTGPKIDHVKEEAVRNIDLNCIYPNSFSNISNFSHNRYATIGNKKKIPFGILNN